MAVLRDLPIQQKLKFAMLLASMTAVFVVSIAFSLYGFYAFRQEMLQGVSAQANLISANSTAALSFDDQETAGEILQALEAVPEIMYATLYTPDEKAFATYARKGLRLEERVVPFRSPGHRFGVNRLEIWQPIFLDHKQIGAISITSDLQEWYAQLQWFTGTVVIIMFLALLGSVLVSRRLRRTIAEPILSLAEAAERVSNDKNYSLRVTKQSQDEVGQLFDAFNNMLKQVQDRDEELEQHRDRLEKQVAERTVELVGTNIQLRQEVAARQEAEMATRQLNEELELRVIARTDELKAANKELESFSYSVSHDLRAPLRVMHGFAKAILENHAEQLDGDGRRYLTRIMNNAQKMTQLIDDLLSFSRLGRKSIKVETFNMEDLTRAVFDELKHACPDRNVCFDLHPLPKCCADRSLIRQVMENLLSNALKFTQFKDPAIIEVKGDSHDHHTHYSVKDNGIGFDVQYASKAFDVFRRLHNQDAFEGTGVGLAIVQRIINRHGGQVWAEGKVDEGAAFSFTIPNIPNK